MQLSSIFDSLFPLWEITLIENMDKIDNEVC